MTDARTILKTVEIKQERPSIAFYPYGIPRN
jgi:hypothetical protein